MRKVYVEVKVRLILRLNEDVDTQGVLDDMDYNFTSTSEGADIEDSEVTEYNIQDSK